MNNLGLNAPKPVHIDKGIPVLAAMQCVSDYLRDYRNHGVGWQDAVWYTFEPFLDSPGFRFSIHQTEHLILVKNYQEKTAPM